MKTSDCCLVSLRFLIERHTTHIKTGNHLYDFIIHFNKFCETQASILPSILHFCQLERWFLEWLQSSWLPHISSLFAYYWVYAFMIWFIWNDILWKETRVKMEISSYTFSTENIENIIPEQFVWSQWYIFNENCLWLKIIRLWFFFQILLPLN